MKALLLMLTISVLLNMIATTLDGTKPTFFENMIFIMLVYPKIQDLF